LFGCVQQDLLYKHYSHKLMQGLVSHSLTDCVTIAHLVTNKSDFKRQDTCTLLHLDDTPDHTRGGVN